MNFDASVIDGICQQLRQADYPRSQNRAKINDLLNGEPPYAPDEVQSSGIVVNHNDLTGSKICHEARQQLYSSILKPGVFFRAKTDWGKPHERSNYNSIVTKEANRPMKNSRVYYETQRSKFASLINSGIAPVSWDNRDKWAPTALGVEDVLLPSNTMLTLENLPFFAIHRSYTAPQLIKLTRGPKNPGWNQTVVKRLLKWLDDESVKLMGSSWGDDWSPEKASERMKGDGSCYSSDNVPTIEAFDFYFWNDDNDVEGWNRRIILDAWSDPGTDGSMARDEKLNFSKGEFLFNPGKRKYADKLDELIAFQYADLSAVAPFRYHSVRSLGWLLYGICHLQNRLHCKFNEAVLENLMIYLRVKSLDDAERALKIEFANRGVIDETVQFLKPEERWQVNENLVQMGLMHNAGLIESNTTSWRQRQADPQQNIEKTKFQVMAEVNASTMLISAALLQAYQYQKFEYLEDFRRMCRKNSTDPDVRTFRNNCLKQGVPEKFLMPEAWEIEPERVMGAGNKTQAMAEASQLMQFRPLFDPEPQRKILRNVTMAITDDPSLTDELVPQVPEISNTIHDTELVFGVLMSGSAVSPKSGLNPIEVIAVMLRAMESRIKRIMQTDGVGTPHDIVGLNLAAQYTSAFLQKLAEDENEKDKVSSANKQLGKLMNFVKAMQQRQQEAAQQRNGNGQDEELQAKLKATLIAAESKAANAREAHAQKTSQKQISWEQKQEQADRQHSVDMQRQAQELEIERAKTGLELAKDRAKADLEIAKERKKQEAQASKPKPATE